MNITNKFDFQPDESIHRDIHMLSSRRFCGRPWFHKIVWIPNPSGFLIHLANTIMQLMGIAIVVLLSGSFCRVMIYSELLKMQSVVQRN